MSDLGTVSTAPPVRVAIVNDFALVVAGMAAVLERYADRVVVVDVGSGSGTSVPDDVDVVLFDTFANPDRPQVPDLDTVVVGRARPLLVYTWNSGPEVIEQARVAGACGLVSKAASSDELVAAIERAHARGVSSADTAAWDARVGVSGGGEQQGVELGRWPGEEHGLSSRQSEVLALICQGLSNQEVAECLYLGVNTVKTYIRQTYRKIEVSTRSQAVIWGMSHGFGPDHERDRDG